MAVRLGMHSPLLVLQYRLLSEGVHRTVGNLQATNTCLMPSAAAFPAASCKRHTSFESCTVFSQHTQACTCIGKHMHKSASCTQVPCNEDADPTHQSCTITSKAVCQDGLESSAANSCNGQGLRLDLHAVGDSKVGDAGRLGCGHCANAKG